jgi:hypothetical protein
VIILISERETVVKRLRSAANYSLLDENRRHPKRTGQYLPYMIKSEKRVNQRISLTERTEQHRSPRQGRKYGLVELQLEDQERDCKGTLMARIFLNAILDGRCH